LLQIQWSILEKKKDSSENWLIMSCRTRNGNGHRTNSAAPEYEEMEKKKKNIRAEAKEEEEEKICHLVWLRPGNGRALMKQTEWEDGRRGE
jgi:hypothetical protein